MRIRTPFAVAFFFLLAISGYAGLSSLQVYTLLDDKAIHFLTFFILTVCFYWILDTSRRRVLNYALIICTGGLGVGSEILQGFLPNGRVFDLLDIAANVVGSLSAIGLCTWYHQRMLDRKRLARQYSVVPGAEEDLELGEGVGEQESGLTLAAAEPREMTGDEELDNWDEHAEDDPWDEEEPATGTDSAEGDGATPSASSTGEDGEGKKRPE